MDDRWLLLVYHLPAEPSRVRVAVWRRLRKLGAVYLEAGAWLLPRTETLALTLQEVVAEVQRHGGAASAFVARGLDPQQEADLRRRFNRAREEEYAEVLRECQKLLDHIQREGEAGHFEFAEVEELEEDLGKIERWLVQVQERDVFAVPARRAVEERLETCREALARFTREAYERGAEGSGQE